MWMLFIRLDDAGATAFANMVTWYVVLFIVMLIVRQVNRFAKPFGTYLGFLVSLAMGAMFMTMLTNFIEAENITEQYRAVVSIFPLFMLIAPILQYFKMYQNDQWGLHAEPKEPIKEQ